MILALGTNESCNLMHVRQRGITAAYDAVRLATRPTTSSATSATAADVVARAQSTLTQLSIVGATATISPTSLTNLAPQTLVTVTITIPLSSNCASSFVLNSSTVISVTATLITE